MRIGGKARWFADITTKEELTEAAAFASEKNIPLIMLGNGANTIFADGTIEALVIRIKFEKAEVESNTVRVSAGKNLAMLINELAKQNLDLSALTGIPGKVGGAIFGNAGQGPKGIWLDAFITDVTAFINGEWKTLTHEECDFSYRESLFKHLSQAPGSTIPPLIWEATLEVPSRPQAEVEAEVQALLQKRIETQPHLKTAGSCFKAVGGTPAWQLIDKVGLRGFKIGDVEIAEKHANFLLNKGTATYADAKAVVETVKDKIPENLEVEMRFIEEDGSLAF